MHADGNTAPDDHYEPTSPADSAAGDMEDHLDADDAENLGYNEDGAASTSMDPNGTPVMDNADEDEHAKKPKPGQEADDVFRCKPCDEREPWTLHGPVKPSKEDVERHYTTHLPYRCWCPVCVKAKGR